jgi:hypothetical protein
VSLHFFSDASKLQGLLKALLFAYTVPVLCTVKKLFDIPVPSRDVTYQLSLGGNNDDIYKLFLPRESLGDILAGDRNIEKLFTV